MLLGDPSRRSTRAVRSALALSPTVSFVGVVCLLLAPVACGDDAEAPKAQPPVSVAGKGGSDASEIDLGLNDNSYCIPGIGNFGDRYFHL